MARRLGVGNRIVSFAAALVIHRVLADDCGAVTGLSRDVFGFDDARIVELVGIVDLQRRLPEAPPAEEGIALDQLVLHEALGLETERAVRQDSRAIVVEFVDGARVDEFLAAHELPDFAVAGIEQHHGPRACRQDALEHAGVAGLRNRLELFPKVTVVAVRADGNAGANRGIQLRGALAPLLLRVALEEEFIEFPTDLRDDDFLGVGGVRDRDADFFQVGLELLLGGLATDELLVGVQIDGKPPVAVLRPGEDLVTGGPPLGETSQVVQHFRLVGAEIVRAVFVDQHPVVVVLVVGVAADVSAALHDQAGCAQLVGQSFGQHEAGETGSDDEEVNSHGEEAWQTSPMFLCTSRSGLCSASSPEDLWAGSDADGAVVKR